MAQVFVCRKGITIASEKDLAGKVVVVGADTVEHKYVQHLRKKGLAIKEVKVLTGSADPFPLVRNGQADVTITDEPVGRYHARQEPGLVVTGFVGHAMDPNPVGIVLRKQDRQLQQVVADALRDMKEDGTFARILEEWFGR
jgi:polar amino acid transport system substrate-binding protein